MNHTKHSEDKNNKKINDTISGNSNAKINEKKPTFITKIKKILPTLPTISLLGFVLNSFRYLKI